MRGIIKIIIGFPVRLIIIVLNLINPLLRKLQIHYETHIAPFIAVRLECIFWPLYKWLVKRNIAFVVNTADSTGHIIAELDNYLRKLYLGKLDRKSHFLWIRPGNNFAVACVKLYRHYFHLAISNTTVYNLLFPITLKYPDITVDAGLSRLKWQLPPVDGDITSHTTSKGQTYLYQITKRAGMMQWFKYYQLRAESPDYFPLQNGKFKDDPLLSNLLKGRLDKLAVIHLRLGVMNATAVTTDPLTYLNTLGYLVDSGYVVVFAGREQMPDIFRKYGIINYANSAIVSFERDLTLFHMADVAIVGGSGIAFLPDTLGKFYLYVNSWHLPLMMPSKFCVCVPALVQNFNGEYLRFSEQIELYNKLPDVGAETFPQSEYFARNATTDEIHAAAQELMALKKTYMVRSPLQDKFSKLAPKSPLLWASSRVSEFFLQKHSDLF